MRDRSNIKPLAVMRRRLLLNSLGATGKMKSALIGLLWLLFTLGDYFFFRRLFAYFNALPLDVGEILIIQLMAALCLMILSMLVFSNVIASLSTLYLSRDLNLLISSPISVGALFAAKFVQTAVNSSWMAVIFSFPVFVAYGQLYYAGWEYYLAFPLLFLLFLITPAGIGVMITMALMRYFPARRTYQILTFIGFTFFAGLVMTLRFLKPEKYLGKKVADEVIIDFVDRLKTPDGGWLPSSILARGLQAGAFSDGEVLAWQFLFLGLMALVTAGLALFVARRIYFIGWAESVGSGETIMPDKERLLYRLARRLLAWLKVAPDMRAIFLKDIKLFWRETGQWSQLFMLGALVVVYIFNIRNLPMETMGLRNVVSVMNIGLAGVVLAAVAARFAFSTTSVEGLSFWTIHAAPVRFSRFLWAKFFLYLTPLLLLAEILVSVSNYFLGVDSFVFLLAGGTIALMTVGLTGLGVGMGALFPRFDYENIAEIGASSGAVAYMIISLIYAGLCAVLVSRPVYVHLAHQFLGRDFYGPAVPFSYAGLLLLTACCSIIPMGMGVRALKRIET